MDDNKISMPSLLTRLLHLCLAVAVSGQLLLSLVMERPRPGVVQHGFETVAFQFHVVVGLTLLPLILCWLLWLTVRVHEDGLPALFPWFWPQPRQQLLQAVRAVADSVRLGHWPGQQDGNTLARAVHGLGVLCALGMALSGAIVWTGMSSHGELAPWAGYALSFHKALASAMWIYLVGHGLMAGLHQYNGEATLRRMFTLSRQQHSPE